jgi:hypothetical protein
MPISHPSFSDATKPRSEKAWRATEVNQFWLSFKRVWRLWTEDFCSLVLRHIFHMIEIAKKRNGLLEECKWYKIYIEVAIRLFLCIV